jgi:hypothetical protein
MQKCRASISQIAPEIQSEVKDAANNKRLAVIRKMELGRIDYTSPHIVVFVGLVTIPTIVALAAAITRQKG